MKSIAILFFLAFLTGFQGAVLMEEPPSLISEPEQQSILEQMQGQFGKVSDQVTKTVNDTLKTMKGHLSDAVAYTAETVKKYISHKIYNRKAIYLVKDAQQYGQSLLNQGKEAVKDQLQKVADMVDGIKKFPPVQAVNEGLIEPAFESGSKFVAMIGEQSLASLSSTIQKNMKF